METKGFAQKMGKELDSIAVKSFFNDKSYIRVFSL